MKNFLLQYETINLMNLKTIGRIAMGAKYRSAAVFTSALLGAITCLSGCATTGMERATKTTNSMQTVEEDYKRAFAQIDVTRTSLEELIKPLQDNMKKAYDAYADDVTDMQKMGKQLDSHTDSMRLKGNEYFSEWESAYTNPEIRELSERRRIEMRENYARIPEASVGVKGSLSAYLSDIGEIQKYLSNDLTPQGIESIRPIAHRALMDGDSVKGAIRRVLDAIDQVKSKMAQGGVNKGS